MKLYKHQIDALESLKEKNHVALYWDMGLGKTFGGSEKLFQLGEKINLIICQKSKIDDWIEHFENNYSDILVYNLTEKSHLEIFLSLLIYPANKNAIGIINYDLVWRRKDLLNLKDFTLLLDESSLIQNETSKRAKFILKMKPKNVILLSGTPTGGKYETLWSQMHLLGWEISKKMFYNHYVDFHWDDSCGFPRMVIDGYKNEERLKRKMREYGCDFIKTDEVFDLPKQIHQTIKVPIVKEYTEFKKNHIVTVHTHVFDHVIDYEWDGKVYGDDKELVGDTTLTKLLYERQLCGYYNQNKLDAFNDLIQSTQDRLIVFYNFNDEFDMLKKIAVNNNRLISTVNGQEKNLEAYNHCRNSITLIQYQAGAMGLNLQKANKIVYFTPPLSSELFEQSKKRIHRIGQENQCFYYYLTCKNSIEEKIYATLAMRKDFTDQLFKKISNEGDY